MSDPLERLERELHTLQPLAPSSRMRQGVAERLDGDDAMFVVSHRRPWRLYWPAVAALAAACVALSVWLWPMESMTAKDDPVPTPIHTARQPAHDPTPTWTVCRMAANRSPDTLLALLDAHADRILIPDKPIVPSAWSELRRNRIVDSKEKNQ